MLSDDNQTVNVQTEQCEQTQQTETEAALFSAPLIHGQPSQRYAPDLPSGSDTDSSHTDSDDDVSGVNEGANSHGTGEPDLAGAGWGAAHGWDRDRGRLPRPGWGGTADLVAGIDW